MTVNKARYMNPFGFHFNSSMAGGWVHSGTILMVQCIFVT